MLCVELIIVHTFFSINLVSREAGREKGEVWGGGQNPILLLVQSLRAVEHSSHPDVIGVTPRVKPADLGAASRLDLMPSSLSLSLSTKTMNSLFFINLSFHIPPLFCLNHGPPHTHTPFIHPLPYIFICTPLMEQEPLFIILKKVINLWQRFFFTDSWWHLFTHTHTLTQGWLVFFILFILFFIIFAEVMIWCWINISREKSRGKGRLRRCEQAVVAASPGFFAAQLSLLTDGLPGKSYYH